MSPDEADFWFMVCGKTICGLGGLLLLCAASDVAVRRVLIWLKFWPLLVEFIFYRHEFKPWNDRRKGSLNG